MATHRDPLPGRMQIGLCGHCILIIAEMVAGIGQDLHQGHADIRHMPFLPFRHGQGEAVKDQLAKAAVILGKVVELRLLEWFRRADLLLFAVQFVGTIDLEAEIQAVIALVKGGMGLPFSSA